MGKTRWRFLPILLAIVPVVLCFIAESMKSKIEPLKLDNDLCFIPQSAAYSLGLASILSSAIAEIIGTVLICGRISIKKPTTETTLLLTLSWVFYGMSLVLLGAATSMNRIQRYGQGWLHNKCYIVKDGIFAASGFLILVASVLLSGLVTC